MRYDLSDKFQREQFSVKVEYLKKEGKIVELTEKRKNRSLSQNAYLHVLFGIFGLEFGLTIDEAKQIIKEKFLSYKKPGINRVFVKETSKLSKDEMIAFIDNFKRFAAEYGVLLPDSEDYYAVQLAMESIKSNEKYLNYGKI